MTGRELEIAERINAFKGIKAIVPYETRIRRSEGETSRYEHCYMPGYIFIWWHMSDTEYYEICDLPGVICILNKGSPKIIPPTQMELVIALAEHGETHLPAPVAQSEGRTQIIDGPLSKFTPDIIRVNWRDMRATIGVRIFSQMHKVTVSI